MGTQGNFKRNLQKFKNREDVKVLLMPISRGANGLNLVEASHVLLMEPLLNPAQELQAIGRVHRIGQSKATCVHRFLVKQTIEERIHQMLRLYHQAHKQADTAGGHSTEENLLPIQDLRNIFVAINEEMSGETEDGESDQGQNQQDQQDQQAQPGRGQGHPGDQGRDQEDQGQDQDEDDLGQDLDQGQGSVQDEDHDEVQRGSQDDFQLDDDEDAADEMLVGQNLPNMDEHQTL